jgi:hypothetical protein
LWNNPSQSIPPKSLNYQSPELWEWEAKLWVGLEEYKFFYPLALDTVLARRLTEPSEPMQSIYLLLQVSTLSMRSHPLVWCLILHEDPVVGGDGFMARVCTWGLWSSYPQPFTLCLKNLWAWSVGCFRWVMDWAGFGQFYD